MKLLMRCDCCRKLLREIHLPLLPESLADALGDAVLLCSDCKESLLTLLIKAKGKSKNERAT